MAVDKVSGKSFAQFLQENIFKPLGKKETLAAAFSTGVLTDGKEMDYGFGWRIDQYRGQPRVWHTGSTSGFRNVIVRYPGAKFTVIILTNRAEPDVAPLADKLTDMFL
jgi:CubicO group peptidase (beta-lactamase class C family)